MEGNETLEIKKDENNWRRKNEYQEEKIEEWNKDDEMSKMGDPYNEL